MRKRLTYLLLMILGALSCTKVVSDAPAGDKPISLCEPVIGPAVKSPLDGTIYPTDGSPFALYGYFTDGTSVDPSNPGNHGMEYIPGAECTYSDSKWMPHYTYDSDKTGYYYWKTGLGYITFAAISPYNVSGKAIDWSHGLSVSGFSPVSDVASQVDLMYTDYTTPTAYVAEGVQLTFKHALAAVRFRFREMQKYESTEDDKIEIIKVEVLNVYGTGDFAQNRTSGSLSSFSSSPAWTGVTGEVASYTLFSKTAGFGQKLSWDDGEGSAEITGIVGETLLPVPQALDHTASGGGKVSVRITYTRDGGTTTNQVAAPLTGLKHGDTVIDQWEMGKRYTYNIVIGLNKILFSPVVSDWTAGNSEDFIIF